MATILKFPAKKPTATVVKRVHQMVQGRPPADPDSKAKAVVQDFWDKRSK